MRDGRSLPLTQRFYGAKLPLVRTGFSGQPRVRTNRPQRTASGRYSGAAFRRGSHYSMRMHRWVTTALLVLVIAGAARTSAAQARGEHSTSQGATGSGRGGTPASRGQAAERAEGQSPSPGRRSTSTLVFVPSPLSVRPPRVPFGPALPLGSIGFGLFSPWAAIPLAEVYGPVIPLEDAPVGGLQLDVEPRHAQVYVDGRQVGIVDQFSGYYHHLDLPAGPHQIEIIEPAYLPLTMDVVVSPGHTTTYRSTLTRAPGH